MPKALTTEQLMQIPGVREAILAMAEAVRETKTEKSIIPPSKIGTQLLLSESLTSGGPEASPLSNKNISGSMLDETLMQRSAMTDRTSMESERREKSIRIGTPTLPTFKGDKDEDVEQFIARFKVLAAEMRWSENEERQRLVLSLGGFALGWYSHLKRRAVSASDLYEELQRAFGKLRAPVDLYNEFLNTIQGISESCVLFARRVEYRAYQYRVDMGAAEILMQYIRGLRIELREHVRLSDPKNLEAAIRQAELKEQTLLAQKPKIYSRQVSIVEKQHSDMVRTSRNQNSRNWETGFQRTRNDQSQQSTCWTCGKVGHRQADCWIEHPEKRITRSPKNSGKNPTPVTKLQVETKDSQVNSVHDQDSSCTPLKAEMKLCGITINVIIDTGASVSVMDLQILKQLQENSCKTIPLFHWKKGQVTGADGTPLKVVAEALIPVGDSEEEVKFVIIDPVPCGILIGNDALSKLKPIINYSSNQVSIQGKQQPLQIHITPWQTTALNLAETTKIPAYSIKNVECDLDGYSSDANPEGIVVNSINGETSWKIPPLLTTPYTSTGKARIQVPICNFTSRSVNIISGKCIGKFEPIEMFENNQISTDLPKSNASSKIEIPTFPVLPTDLEFEKDLEETLKKCSMEILQEEKDQLRTLLKNYGSMFVKKLRAPGQSHHIPHRIDTQGAMPIKKPPFRIGFKEREIIGVEVKKMLNDGVIRPSKSPWSAPIVLVTKKDGTTRFCVDYRGLNSVTKKDSYPLPRIDEILDNFSGSNYFSTLDLCTGYWQVPIHEPDKEKTAFASPQGMFEFNVVPFGLTNAPSSFQRDMDLVLTGLTWKCCLVYMDDIIIYSPTFDQHLKDIEKVLQQLEQAQMFVKITKCHFAREQLPFLGHIISNKGIAPDPAKTILISNMNPPKDLHQVRQFLGLTSYYRRFIPQYAHLAESLIQLTRKEKAFLWTEECQKAFSILKNKLITPPILSYPKMDKTFVIECDASDFAIGAVLSQPDENGMENVIAYGSKTLQTAERNYSTTEKECLSVVYWVRTWRCYLWGNTFKIVTDHGSLQWLMNLKDPSGRLARWALRLQEFNFTIQHRPGKNHRNADSMTRPPIVPVEEMKTPTLVPSCLPQKQDNQLKNNSNEQKRKLLVRTGNEDQESIVNSSEFTESPSKKITEGTVHTLELIVSTEKKSNGTKERKEHKQERPMKGHGRNSKNTGNSAELEISHVPIAAETEAQLLGTNQPCHMNEEHGERLPAKIQGSSQQGNNKNIEKMLNSIESKISTIATVTAVNAPPRHVEKTMLEPGEVWNWKEEQRKSQSFAKYISYLENGTLPKEPELAVRIVAEGFQMMLHEGILYHVARPTPNFRRKESTWRLAVPESIQEKLFARHHDGPLGGHLGYKKVFDQLSQKYWWPRMYNDIMKWTLECQICQAHNSPKQPTMGKLQNIPVEGPWHRIGMDLVGPLPESKFGNKYILVIQDYFTKWPEAFPLKSMTAEEVAQIYVEELICRHGAPQILLTDQGKQFVGQLLHAINEKLKVSKAQTTAYHPQTDGLVERFNGTLLHGLAKLGNENQDDWDRQIPYFLAAYRWTPQESTKETPFFLMYGRDPRFPEESTLLSNLEVGQKTISDHKSYLID